MPAASPAADEVVDKPVCTPSAPAVRGAGLEPLDAARLETVCGTDRGGGPAPERPGRSATGAAALAHRRRGRCGIIFPGSLAGAGRYPNIHHQTLS